MTSTKNNSGVIFLIMWPMLKFLLKFKEVLYQVCKVSSFYSSFSDADQKVSLPFKILKSLPSIWLSLSHSRR